MSDLLDLYNECRARGLNVAGLAGWTDWQQGYWYRREREWSGSGSRSNPPTCLINHHTATTAYTPNVKNSAGQSKANIWLGLDRGNTGTGRMHSTGTGVGRADFAVRWAANYGNGACDRSVYESHVWRDRIAPNRPAGSDDGYANKIAVGMEIIHPGDGSTLHPSVWELAAQINAAAIDVFGWSIARILDHRSSTRRKVDIRFAQKEDGYSINALRSRIVEIGAGTPPIDPPDEELEMFLPLTQGMGMGDLSAKGADVVTAQRLLNKVAAVSPKIKNDGKYGDDTARAVAQAFGRSSGASISGNDYASLQEWAYEGTGTGGPLPDHTHTPGGVA